LDIHHGLVMFSRRDIQRALDQLASSLSSKQLALLVQRLNSNEPEQIGAEWEAVVLAATSRVAELRHEYDCGGTSRPDIYARLNDEQVEFVADICTVSDADIEDDNPVEYFRHEIYALARSLGMKGAGLFLDVERLDIEHKTQRELLALPPKGEIQRFVSQVIRPFLKEVSADPSKDAELRHSDGARFTLRYVAREKVISGGSWPTYTWPRTIKNNPLYAALHKKARQLRKSGFNGTKGIIACDGGCESVTSRGDAIVNALFAQGNSSVSFVALLSVPDVATGKGPRIATTVKFHWNPNAAGDAGGLVERVLNRIGEHIPLATSASQYARNRNLQPDLRYLNSFEGAYMIESGGSPERIRISARAALQALAGNIRFRESAGYSIPVKVFQAQIAEGRVIKAIYLERSEHDDDDWLVIDFDGPDAAVSPYKVP
jgi:hypothetical protein